ncbi:MAG: hypothetical protein H6600_08025 [Flavobacteriales bacterium]|nr:hypothetical protein [Flavobacteriales bacterium]MCB9198390.1 hypothetical protein [Flavobacteriales bacterium]
MKSLLTILFITLVSSLFAFEGVIHGVKTTNGVSESFDIYMKGNLIAIEGEDGQGKYRVIIDRTNEEIFVCIDNPAFGNKGYYHFTAEQLKREKKFQIISSLELTESKEIAGEKCNGYSMVTDQGSVVMYVSEKSEADLTGISKYMDDPVYELIDSFGVKSSIRKIAVQKEDTSYTVELTEESMTVESSKFEIPQGYEKYEIKLSTKQD